MRYVSKIISIFIATIMLTASFAGAVPAMVDYEPIPDLLKMQQNSPNMKLMHRSIDYGAAPLSSSYITPSYESQNNLPSVADLSFYPATTASFDVLNSAEKNQYDPGLIYSFVHNYFDYVPYYGSLKGAHLTYMDRSGNDADLSSLTISLLRASDIPARYVHGTIELNTKQAKNYFNVNNESVIVDMLHENGLSAQAVSGGVRFEHIWVEAYIDGNWLGFDPSFKQYNSTSGMDMSTLAQQPGQYSSIMEDYVQTSGDVVTQINISGINESFSSMSDNFSTLLNTEYANSTNSEIFGTRQIIAHTDYYTIPANLPYTVKGVHGEYADLPDTFNHKLGIKLPGIDVNFNTTQIAEKRLSVFYEPSTQADKDIFNASDNLSSLNALDINMSALLRIDGALVAVGDPHTLGSEQEMEISFIAPGGQKDSYTRSLQTGAYFVIGLALQPVSTGHMSERVKRYEVTGELVDLDYFNVTNDELYGELLNLQALTFWGKYGLYNSIASKATDVIYTRHPSAILVGTELDINETNATRSVGMSGVYSDIVRDIINPTARDGDSSKSYSFLFTRGMTASSMEQSMLSLSYNVTAYSTTGIIREAGRVGIPILTLNDSNWAAQNSLLNISADQKTIVEDAVNLGYSVIIPRDEVQTGNFTGSVFIVFDPETGASSFYGPDGKGWGWLDTLKSGLEAGISAASTVVKGAAKTIADTGGKIAGVATGVISTVGEAVNGTGSTLARVTKTAITGAVNAAGYVVTTVLPGAAAGVTAATSAGLVIVTAFTADRLTELGKTIVDIYDAEADYERSLQEYKETQEKIKEKKEQIKKEELEKQKEDLEKKKEDLEDKKEEIEEEEEIDLDDDSDDPEDLENPEDPEEDEFPGDDEEPDELELDEELELEDIPEPEDDPVDPSSPGGDHPDDTFSVASSRLRNSDVTSLQIRNAYKKGYINPVHLNEYRIGQLGMKGFNDYTSSTDLDAVFELSGSQSNIYTEIVKNYDTIQEELGLSPDVLMLQKGFYASAKSMVEYRGVPVSLIRVQDFITANTTQLVHDTPVLFLPSGSLYGLDSSAMIQEKFADYVAQGGTLFVMAQQHGYEYNILPHNGTRALGGAGWQEDQSCLYNAASINEYHPVISGQPDPTLTVNIDGYFTSYPEDSTIILKRNKNSMPAMLAYEYYNGTVIATSVYDDWAYLDGASTFQGELLVRDVMAWAVDPDNVDMVLATNSIDIPLNISNNGDFAATKVYFNFTDPLGNVKVNDSIELTNDLEPGSDIQLNFTCGPRSADTKGIWNLDYILVNESDTIYTKYDARKVAIGNYVVSEQGYSTTENITYSVRSTNDHFAYGSDAVFTITVWNQGNTDENVTLNYCFPHHGWIEYDPDYGIDQDRSWYNLEENLTVPAQGSTSFNHRLENVRTYDRLWSHLYNSNGQRIGSSSLGIYCFHPKLDIEFESGNKLKAGSNNTLNFTVSEESGDIYNASVEVKIYDARSNLVKRESIVSNMTREVPYNGSVEFSPVNTGSYNLVVEVTKEGQRLGTNSLFIIVKDKVVNINVEDEPVYRFNSMNDFTISIDNMEQTNLTGLELETVYLTPEGNTAYLDTITLDIEAQTNRQFNVSVPFNKTFFGRNLVVFTLSDGTEVLDSRECSFNYLPRMNSYLSSYVLVRDTEENIKVSVTNGEAPAELGINITSPQDLGYQNYSRVFFEAGENKVIDYKLPVRANIGAGAIIVNLEANNLSRQSYSVLSDDLQYRAGSSKLTPSYPASVLAGSNLTFNITNEGPSGTRAAYSIYFLGSAESNSSVEIYENATISVDLPVPMVSSGNYNLIYDIQNMGTYRSTYRSVPVHIEGFDLNMTMEETQLRADRSIPVTMNNSGIEMTVDLEARLVKGSDRTVLSAENVTIGSGEQKVVDMPLSSSLESGAYSLSLRYQNSSYGVFDEKYYTVKINGLDLEFSVQDKEYDAGERLDLIIDNVGEIGAASNVTAWLDGDQIGSRQASTPAGERTILNYQVPGVIATGSSDLFVICKEKNSGRTLSYSKTISISGLEYELNVEPVTVRPSEELEATVANTGKVSLSGDYELVLSDSNSVIANTTGNLSSVAPGENETVSLVVPLTNSGEYTFTFDLKDQLGTENSKSVSVYIPDPSFDMSLNASQYLQGDPAGVSLDNISNIGNGRFTMTLFDGQNNTISTATEDKDASGGSVDLVFNIPEGILTGSYVLLVDARDRDSGLENSTSASLRVNGMTLTPDLFTDRVSYIEDDNVTYEARLNYTGSLPEGNASVKAYLREGITSSEEFMLESKYPVTGVARIGDTLFIGTNAGLYEESGYAQIREVENSQLASMKISGLDVAGGLLWIQSEGTVYSYDPQQDRLNGELIFDYQENEHHGGGSILAVDTSDQVIYMPDGWDGAIAHSYDGSGDVTYYNSTNTPLSGQVTDIIVLPGEVLFMAENSCHSLSGSSWKMYNTSDGLLSDTIYSAVADNKDLYFITNTSISHRDVSGGSISTEYEFGNKETVTYIDEAGIFDGDVYYTSNTDLYIFDTDTKDLDISTIFDGFAWVSDLGVGNSGLWICNNDKLYCVGNNSTGLAVEVTIPQTFAPYGKLAFDRDSIINIAEDTLNIYDISTQTWNATRLPEGFEARGATLSSGYIWIASDTDLIRIDRDNQGISSFNESNSVYSDTGVSWIKSYNGDLWVAGSGGLSIYSISDGVEVSQINMTSVSDPDDITSSGTIVAVIDSNGMVYEYDYGTDAFTTYGTGLSDSNGFRFAYSDGVYWIVTTSLSELYSYDTQTSALEKSKLSSIWTVGYAGEILYVVNTSDGVFSLESGQWSEYEGSLIPENSWINGIISGERNVLIYGEGWITSLRGEFAEPVLDRTVNLSEFSDSGTSLSWQDNFTATKQGQLSFELEVLTNYQQRTGTVRTSVDVYEKDVSLALSTAKDYYRTDETINTTVLVSNNAPALFERDLVILIDGNESERFALSIPSAGNSRYEEQLSALAAGDHTISAEVGDLVVTRNIVVENPAVRVSLNAPKIVSSEPFTVEIFADNPGNVSAGTVVKVSNLDLDVDEFEILLPPQTSRSVEFNATIDTNTTIIANFSADVSSNLTSDVEFGERVNITCQCQPVYRTGTVEIPINISNIGEYNSDFNVTFSVNATNQVNRSYLVGINQSIEDVLVFELSAGNYTLNASGEIPVIFEDVPFSAGELIDFEATAPVIDSGNLTFRVNLSNGQTHLPFNGTIEVVTDFYDNSDLVNLSAMENISTLYELPLPQLSSGNYTLNVSLLENEEVIDMINSTFTIKSPQFSVMPASSNKQSVQPAETVNYNFTVSNTGSIGGLSDMYLDIPGIYEETMSSWIPSGGDYNFSFSFKAPDDLPEGYYTMYYGLEEDSLNESSFYLEGANVSVTSWLDRRAYLPGENATLTMQVKNNGNYTMDLYSRIKYLDFEDVHQFTSDGGNTTTFTVEIPISETGNKVFISIYLNAPEGGEDSGRSLYINSDYIHDRRDINGLRISTAKQAYEAGETVVMNVNVTRADHLTIAGPGLDHESDITGNTTVEFDVPNILSGVYRYDITYGESSGEYLLDIHGFSLIVMEAEVELESGGE